MDGGESGSGSAAETRDLATVPPAIACAGGGETITGVRADDEDEA